MKGLKIWMYCVGVFYILLTLMNLYGFIIDPQLIANTLPEKYKGIPEAAMAFSDAWFVFIMEFMCLGIMLLYAAKNPLQNKIMVWVIILAEFFRGIVADGVWISKGYAATDYLPFMVIHALIIGSGFYYLKKAEKES